jgi:hypothetical protein
MEDRRTRANICSAKATGSMRTTKTGRGSAVFQVFGKVRAITWERCRSRIADRDHDTQRAAYALSVQQRLQRRQ